MIQACWPDHTPVPKGASKPVAPAREKNWVNCEFSWPICFVVKYQVIVGTGEAAGPVAATNPAPTSNGTPSWQRAYRRRIVKN